MIGGNFAGTTATGTAGLVNGEANLTFDGTTLSLSGTLDMLDHEIIGVTDITMTGLLKGNGTANIQDFNEINANVKNFDIPHPSKEGWRLRYSVLEGPEFGEMTWEKDDPMAISLSIQPDYCILNY